MPNANVMQTPKRVVKTARSTFSESKTILLTCFATLVIDILVPIGKG